MTSAVFRCCFPMLMLIGIFSIFQREPPNHHAVHVTSLSCCIVSRKSDTILPPQGIQLEDGKSGQTPQLEPASRWDLWHKLSLQCLEMLHTQQLLLARIVKLKKARVFYNWQVILPFVPNIYIALEMLRFDFTNFNKYTLK